MKKTIIVLILCLSTVNILLADVTIEIKDLGRKIMRVTYTIEETRQGATDDTLPLNGFAFASGDINVISVSELNTDKKLKYDIVKKNDKQAVKIYYPDALPKDANYKIQCVVEANTDDISMTSAGMYEFSYFTGHDAYFILPKDHAVVYSNLPIILYDKNGRIVVLVKADEYFPHNIVLKTKSYAR